MFGSFLFSPLLARAFRVQVGVGLAVKFAFVTLIPRFFIWGGKQLSLSGLERAGIISPWRKSYGFTEYLTRTSSNLPTIDAEFAEGAVRRVPVELPLDELPDDWKSGLRDMWQTHMGTDDKFQRFVKWCETPNPTSRQTAMRVTLKRRLVTLHRLINALPTLPEQRAAVNNLDKTFTNCGARWSQDTRRLHHELVAMGEHNVEFRIRRIDQDFKRHIIESDFQRFEPRAGDAHFNGVFCEALGKILGVSAPEGEAGDAIAADQLQGELGGLLGEEWGNFMQNAVKAGAEKLKKELVSMKTEYKAAFMRLYQPNAYVSAQKTAINKDEHFRNDVASYLAVKLKEKAGANWIAKHPASRNEILAALNESPRALKEELCRQLAANHSAIELAGLSAQALHNMTEATLETLTTRELIEEAAKLSSSLATDPTRTEALKICLSKFKSNSQFIASRLPNLSAADKQNVKVAGLRADYQADALLGDMSDDELRRLWMEIEFDTGGIVQELYFTSTKVGMEYVTKINDQGVIFLLKCVGDFRDDNRFLQEKTNDEIVQMEPEF